MTVGVPDALQLLIASATDVSLVVVGLHQVEEEASKGVGVTLNVDELVSNSVRTCIEDE